MGLAFKIIEMFQKNQPVEEIEKEVQWENLTQADYEELFSEANHMQGSKSGFDLLGLMYKAVKDRDFWMETRILAAVIAHPEADVERSKLLKRMAYSLEQIRPAIARIPKNDPIHQRYRRYLCDYVLLSARLLEEAGDVDKALKEYTAAQKAYSKYNFLLAAKEVEEPIARLQQVKRQGDQLVLIKSLVDRRSLLEKQITDLNTKSQQMATLLDEIVEQSKAKETELNNLNMIIEELDMRLDNTQKSLQKITDEVIELENRRTNSQDWLDQVEREKTALVEQVITLREEAQQLDIRVAQSTLKLNDRLAALQAQIDLKGFELNKIEAALKHKSEAYCELEELIAQRRQELAAIEETIHLDEAYLAEISRRRSELETEQSLAAQPVQEPAVEEANVQPQGELATKLERYKKSLKASRNRKKAATEEPPSEP